MSNPFTEGEGFEIYDSHIPQSIIDSINSKLHSLRPVRASSADKHYAEGSKITDLPDIAVWWSQMTTDWPEVRMIDELVRTNISDYLWKPRLYSSDIVTIEPNSKWVNAHVDTPHRFERWNEDDRLLGIQCIVALQDTTPEMGSTGLVPYSYKQDWNIQQCYNGDFNKYFWDNHVQNILSSGSVLLYNCRVLHSSMPNYMPEARPMLLLNYLTSDIIKDVKAIDNIWSSNGRSCND